MAPSEQRRKKKGKGRGKKKKKDRVCRFGHHRKKVGRWCLPPWFPESILAGACPSDPHLKLANETLNLDTFQRTLLCRALEQWVSLYESFLSSPYPLSLQNHVSGGLCLRCRSFFNFIFYI